MFRGFRYSFGWPVRDGEAERIDAAAVEPRLNLAAFSGCQEWNDSLVHPAADKALLDSDQAIES